MVTVKHEQCRNRRRARPQDPHTQVRIEIEEPDEQSASGSHEQHLDRVDGRLTRICQLREHNSNLLYPYNENERVAGSVNRAAQHVESTPISESPRSPGIWSTPSIT